MPEYDLIEYDNFAAGLWETESVWTIPKGGMTELVDAYPTASGELTPAPRFTVIPQVGLPSGTQVVGLGISGFHYTPTGWPASAEALPRLLMACATLDWDTSSDLRIMYAQLSPENGLEQHQTKIPFTFSTLTTHASALAVDQASKGIQYSPVTFAHYYTTAGGLKIYYNVPDEKHGGAVAGIWRIETPTGDSVTRAVASGATTPEFLPFSHQDRLGGLDKGTQEIFFTAPGVDTAFSESLLADPSDPILNIFAVSFYPDNLLILRYPRGVYQIQGDITAPFNRQIDESFPTNVFSYPAVTPYGLVYISPSRGAALFNGEPPAQDISGPRFDSIPMVPAATILSQLGESAGFTDITVTSLTSGNNASSGSSASRNTASITPPANQLILASIGLEYAGSVTITSVTGCGLTWVLVGETTFRSNGSRVAVFRAMGPAPTNGPVTFNFSGEVLHQEWSVVAVDGVATTGSDGADAVRNVVTGFDDSSPPDPFVITLGAFERPENGTFGAFSANDNGPDLTAGSGFTRIHYQESASSRLATEWKPTNDTSVDIAGTSDQEIGGVAFELRAGGSAIAASSIPDTADSVGMENLGIPFLGQLAFGNDWVFTPLGYIYDFRTEAWFRITLPALPDFHNYLFWTYDKFHEVVYAAGTRGTGLAPQVIAAQVGVDDSSPYPQPSPTYKFTLAPVPLVARNQEIAETHFRLSRAGPGVRVEITIESEDNDIAPVVRLIDSPRSRVFFEKTPFVGRTASVSVKITDKTGDPAPDCQYLALAVQPRSLQDEEAV